ncbi:hypothetical protein AO501_25280 [Mycobacterium gordonae]|uniref:Head-to-tail adaptor n=1 Tax=Mycobacterium gordonae TaxID=1778 RepID=A0A0Q2U4D9_MYCGO|nr:MULTISPECIES: hypothetical protein [Mycobacterium]KQH75592.1 hypothetical protein AO501_25280 [Mycobacterium gordonae]MDP7732090.1 hypothetical protein [Mycobacterium sp. TY813]
MAELAPGDLPAAVRARFANDTAAQAWINAALAAARRYCGWHVCPLNSDQTVELDGPGGPVLSLPTLNLVSVTSVTELGTTLDVNALDRSRRKGTLTKRFGRWTGRDGAITAVVTHGFTETEAADWRQAVLELVDRMSAAVGAVAGNSGPMVEKTVDDVTYKWQTTVGDPGNQLLFSMLNHELVDSYRILPSP